MSVDLITANAVDWANEYSGELFHAIFCDAPYHLTTITKRFGKEGSAPAQYGKDGAFARASKGFMGQEWDGGDVAFRPETWYAFGKVLYPGAFGIAYASSRGYHRMAVAIEDAGFIIHPMIGWLQAQGMPKATRIDTQIQKRSEQKVIGSKLGTPGYSMTDAENQGNTLGWSKSKRSGKAECEILEPTDDLAKAWVGHRYGLQALAPSLEPICVFQKPYEGRPLDNITQTGAGALNIDAARIPSAEPYTINTWDDDAHPFGDGAGNPYTSRQETGGRWPKNFIIDKEMSGIFPDSKPTKPHPVKSNVEKYNGYGSITQKHGEVINYDETESSASRFFFNVQEQIDEADPIFYQAKVSPRERNAGLESTCTIKYNIPNIDYGGISCKDVTMVLVVLLQRVTLELMVKWSIGESGESIMGQCQPDSLSTILTEISKITTSQILDSLMSLHTNEYIAGANLETESGGSSAQYAESGNRLQKTIGILLNKDGSLIAGVENVISDLLLKLNEKENWKRDNNIHPCCKPISLNEYLASLLLPPALYAPRRLFNPFAGVSSESIGAYLAGWEEVVGVEWKPDYVEIGNLRLKYWLGKPRQLRIV